MAHYAFLDENNIVVEVIVGKDENDLDQGVTNWEEWYGNFKGMTCKRTSYNTRHNTHSEGGTPLRKNYAGIGYHYDESRDAFIPPKPFPSWVLNEEICDWEPPVPRPEEEFVKWDENSQNWVPLT